MPSIEAGDDIQSPATVSAPSTSRELENDKKRPNVHAALHYGRIAREYGMPSHLNVLIAEDKHR